MTFAASQVGVCLFWEVGSKYLLLRLYTAFCIPTWLNWKLVWQSRWGHHSQEKANSAGRKPWKTHHPRQHWNLLPTFSSSRVQQPPGTKSVLNRPGQWDPSKREYGKLGMIVKVTNLGKDG